MSMVEFHVLVQQTAADAPLQVTLLADEEIRALPPEQATERLSSLLHHVRVRPEFTIYGFGTFASYVEPPNPAQFRGYNTLVEVNLPYTLHLPSGMLFPVADQQGVVRGLLQTRKIWTDLADGSNNVEALADDQVLYHGPALPATPHVPQDPVLGPWPRFTGQNVELGKDTHGIFRYTQVRLLFDTEHTGIDGEDNAEAVKEARNAAVITTTSTAAEFVNHVLDVYRHVTGENHVERLPRQLVTRLYFADVNVVYESVGLEGGVGSAIINRSRREIDRFAAMLAAGEQPAPHTLLLQSARSALDRGQLLLGVVVAFQAQEMVIEAGIRTALQRQGVSDEDITTRLKGRLSTKDRLTTLSREALNGRSVADDNQFWNRWLQDCNRKRNDTVHRGLPLTETQARLVVALCEDCIARFLAL
ncbi:MAG: hypothetical protein WCB12_14065 [Bryobacteraceae bacterium]